MATATKEITVEEATTGLPKVCPTCGATRGGSSGAAHACSAVPTIASKTGRGIVYAPTTRICGECGGKAHRNLARSEQDLICAWVQYSRGTTGGATDMLNVDNFNVKEFGDWAATTGLVRRAPKPRGRPAGTSAPTAPAKSVAKAPASVAEAVAEKAPEEKKEKAPAKTKEEKRAARAAKMKAELKGK